MDENLPAVGARVDRRVRALVPVEELHAAMDQLIAEGLIEVVPACTINLPPAMAARLAGLQWMPWDGDQRSLRTYRATVAGLELAAEGASEAP